VNDYLHYLILQDGLAKVPRMGEDGTIELSDLPKPKWADLHALVGLAPIQLSKPNCVSLSLLGRGSYNFVYRLQFEDGSDVAASVSKDDEEDFNPSAKLSEISTMRYVWNFTRRYVSPRYMSGICLSITLSEHHTC
jgi:hypothetical protein